MAHEIIEAFLAGKKVRNTYWNKNSFMQIVNNKVCVEAYTDKDYALKDLILSPNKYELYQEPKKAWIYSDEFNTGHVRTSFDCKARGAIALAREFLKRYKTEIDENFNRKFNIPYIILTDLVGEENLK